MVSQRLFLRRIFLLPIILYIATQRPVFSSTSRLHSTCPPFTILIPRPPVPHLDVVHAHLVDYATHEVPLPLFGLGHDWACTFSGAPLPRCGQA